MNNLEEKNIKSQEQELQNDLSKEWLETNGLGSYSSSSSLFCHSRKYHGLLVSASNKSTQRTVLISKFDEFIESNNEEKNISLNYYQPGVYVPFDPVSLEFDYQTHPRWLIKDESFTLYKDLVMVKSEDTVFCSYKFKNTKSNYLRLNPLVAFRDFHHLIKENQFKQFKVEFLNNEIKISSPGIEQELYIQFSCEIEIERNSYWYRNFLYQEEERRGFDAVEDLFCPASCKINLKNNPEFIVSVSTQKQKDIKSKFKKELNSREKISSGFLSLKNSKQLLLERLEKARKDFIIETSPGEYSVIAGYHWFNSWGRDTFIALPGLLMKSNDKDLYINILKGYLQLQNNGLLPNMTGASKEDSAYNCIDASLWMFWSLEKFIDEFDNIEWLIDIWKDLRTIYLAYYNNQAPGVEYHDNGLLKTGSPEDTLSWMDAMVDGKAASPRWGYLIEVNALWLNANILMHDLAVEFKDEDLIIKTSKVIKKLERNFEEYFWNEELGFFVDHLRDGVQDTKLRPNQLFALGLDCIELDPEKALKAITKITNELLTPYGLMTLNAKNPEFRAKYQGDGRERDSAYHNGTVWAWLIGAYTDAVLKYSGNKKEVKSKLKKLLLNFNNHLDEAGLNSVSEIFDATAPFTPRGCIAQAWSVSELRRSLLKI